MSPTDNRGWLRSLRLDPAANDPGIYPIAFCFKCSKLVCYLPACITESRVIACISCGSGPGSRAIERGLVPIPQLAWQVNHAQFTTIMPPTIEELHSKECVNVEPLTRPGRVRPVDLPLEIESISLDDHVTLGSEEDENKSPLFNHHRGRINSAIDEEQNEQEERDEHGPAQQ